MEEFDFGVSRWFAVKDKELCKKVRGIKREDIDKHPNPELKIEVIDDEEFSFRLVWDIFSKIKSACDEGRRLVLIMPQTEPRYRWVARLINEFRVDCSRLYTFNMDEYADEDGNIAPETWHASFLGAMKKNFFAQIDEDLRPPEEQILGPTNDNFSDYGKMLSDLGGADVCFGGIGWCGHLAFIDPGTEAFAAADLDEWKTIGPRIVELCPTTILQNSLGADLGGSGDWSFVPPKAATIGPAEICGAKLRSSWNGFVVGDSDISWQKFIVRLALHGDVTPAVPASLLQTMPGEVYLSESVAASIEPKNA